ncbi:MAG: S-methyl-5-thioribose-1-phosphate isomerase [Gemmatimonadota bacterium]|nr:S-methyl-5-thioribose-1-phosphate isomerase [Gemmatimonadota bacterium]
MEQIEPPVRAVGWSPAGTLRILDQRLLPGRELERDLGTIDEVADAIRTLAVRGAPAIGVAAAIALASALPEVTRHAVEAAAALLRATRPTAVNLGWAIDRMLAVARALPPAPSLDAALRAEAERIRAEDEAMCRRIGEHGQEWMRDGVRVLTHCNAGALATAGIGTALAPLYVAHARGRRVEVLADETRPLLQGARLTAWELQRAGIPVTVLTDGMAASLMAAGRVDLVLVGADRIAANGDVANKIGSYGLAVLARHHGIPFVVAAPWSTVDLATATGAAIEIEQRGADEVALVGDRRVVAAGVAIHNPAFDVTPHALVSAIVTDRGVLRAPFPFVANVSLVPPPI